MRISHSRLAATLLTLALSMSLWHRAYAHLMVAQHGTLNVVNNGVFMVLSLPISAFNGLDNNGDGKISMLEFNKHRSGIVKSVRQHVTLSDKQGDVPLQGIMLSPVAPHDSNEAYLSQITVMGRFKVNKSISDLRFYIGLYGRQASEQLLEITATRAVDSQTSVFKLTPGAPASEIFSGSARLKNAPVAWHL